jgi:excisionase family DNA binding protein
MDRTSGGTVVGNRRRHAVGEFDLRLDEPLWTVEKVARLLSVKRAWVYTATREGVLPYVKVGRHLRFVRADIERWILEHRNH